MEKLELKIPPLLLMLIFALVMYLIARVDFLYFSTGMIGKGVALILATIGILFCGLGVAGFRKANTTVNPVHPETTSTLVQSGIYGITRNPMYVGFAVLLMAWGVFLGSIPALVFGFVFVPYMNRLQIKPEERMLESLFGEEYLSYMNRVRRWI